MTESLVGTASWTHRTLIKSGRFYPSEVRSAEARLRYYTSQFCLVDREDFTRRSYVSEAPRRGSIRVGIAQGSVED